MPCEDKVKNSEPDTDDFILTLDIPSSRTVKNKLTCFINHSASDILLKATSSPWLAQSQAMTSLCGSLHI